MGAGFQFVWQSDLDCRDYDISFFAVLITIIQILRIIIIWSLFSSLAAFQSSYFFAEFYGIAAAICAIPIPSLMTGNPFKYCPHDTNKIGEILTELFIAFILIIAYALSWWFCILITAFFGSYWYFDITFDSLSVNGFNKSLREILESNDTKQQILIIAMLNYMNDYTEYKDEYRAFIDNLYESNKLEQISFADIMKYCPIKINVISYIQCFFRQNFKLKTISKRILFSIHLCGYILFFILPFWIIPLRFGNNTNIVIWEYVLFCILVLLECIVIFIRYRYIFPVNYARRHLFNISPYGTQNNEDRVRIVYDIYDEIAKYTIIYKYVSPQIVAKEIISYITGDSSLSNIVTIVKDGNEMEIKPPISCQGGNLNEENES